MALFCEEEVKLPEEVVVRDRPVVALSAAVEQTAPILADSDVTMWVVRGEVNVEVMHRESMRTFSAQLRAEDLEKCGFHPRDTAEDCVEIMSDALGAEDIDTVAVAPMASPLEGSDTDTACVKVPFSECEFMRIFFALKFRKKLYEYSFVASEQKLDAATHTQLQLQSLKQKVKTQSQQMELQRTEIGEVKAAMETMKEAITAQSKTETDSMKKMKAAMELMEATKKAMKAQSKTEIDSVKAAMEEKMAKHMEALNAGMDMVKTATTREITALKKAKIDADTKAKTEMDTVKAAMDAMKAQSKKEMDAMKLAIEESEEKTTHQIEALKSKGIASFRSDEMVESFRKWNSVELAPTLDAMGALSEDQSSFRIGIEGVYRVLTAVSIRGDMRSGLARLYINGFCSCDPFGGQCTSTVMSFVGRLRVGDTVKVYISGNENNGKYRNWLQIEKL